ncbi:hypothetical protein CPB86DRAFT_819505, partial [Serendipita vermifera]
MARILSTPEFNKSNEEALLEEITSVDVVPIETLLSSVLRPIPPDDLLRVKDCLLERRVLSKRYGWRDFPRQPSEYPTNPYIFKRLETMYASILEAAASCGVLEEKSNLLAPLFVDDDFKSRLRRYSTSRPEGYLYLKKPSAGSRVEGRLDYADLALILGLRRRRHMDNRKGNTGKLLWNMNHRMSVDPRCRHIFGLSMEDTQTRLWRCDRGVVAVSEAFNFMKEPDYLIHIFLALAGSTEIELGFDPTVKCVGIRSITPEAHSTLDGETDQEEARSDASGHDQRSHSSEHSLPIEERGYHILVRDEEGDEHTFETVRLISDRSARIVRSNGTRVWEVFDINDPSRTRRVLKDTWCKKGKTPEGEIVKDIRSCLQNEPESLLHLPEVLMHGAVHLSKDTIDEVFESTHRKTNRAHNRRRTIIGERNRFSFYSPKPLTRMMDQEGGRCDTRDTLRYHWRLVYVGSPGIAFSDIKQYDGMLLALIDALKALQAIYSAGYIHRHVSSTNILSTEDGTKGLLIDFKYAQKFTEFPQSGIDEEDITTGELFKPMETLMPIKTFLFRPHKPSTNPEIEKYYNLPWFHNPIHDMESIWWIAIWLTLFYTETGEVDDST